MKDKDKEKSNYLIKNGWVLDEHGAWRLDGKGGYSTPFAYDVQKEQEILDAGLYLYKSFRVRGVGSLDYGYVISRQLKNDKKWTRVIYYEDNDQKSILKTVNHFQANQTAPTFNGYLDYNYDTNYHYLLIFKEKHGDYLFYVPTYKNYLLSCLEVALRRINEGYWYDDELHKIEVPVISKEQILNWKDSPVKRAAEQEWKNYEYLIKENINIEKDIILITNIKNHKKDKEKAARSAAELLERHNQGEYERMSGEEMQFIEN